MGDVTGANIVCVHLNVSKNLCRCLGSSRARHQRLFLKSGLFDPLNHLPFVFTPFWGFVSEDVMNICFLTDVLQN